MFDTYQEHLEFEAGAQDMEAYCMGQEVYREMEVDAYYNYLDNMEADGKTPLDFKAWKTWLTEKVPEPPQAAELEDPNAPGCCPF